MIDVLTPLAHKEIFLKSNAAGDREGVMKREGEPHWV